jgi:hypothetical protein
MEIGGYNKEVDLPKLGPSLLIATCLIVAVRTAKWPAVFSERTSNVEFDREIEYAAFLANRVLSHLVAKKESIFHGKRVPWYQANDDEVPK